ncbi:unnamed protein product [Bemisia tabaci]|uniref:Receptor ligand binding region domain-containing protein n=1 Tax=Bemisia tabaci TaxID=7038 RepID=A0A9P0F4V2_BEMTA|nr:unnamed protein product [Bemisia tabaci]
MHNDRRQSSETPLWHRMDGSQGGNEIRLLCYTVLHLIYSWNDIIGAKCLHLVNEPNDMEILESHDATPDSHVIQEGKKTSFHVISLLMVLKQLGSELNGIVSLMREVHRRTKMRCVLLDNGVFQSKFEGGDVRFVVAVHYYRGPEPYLDPLEGGLERYVPLLFLNELGFDPFNPYKKNMGNIIDGVYTPRIVTHTFDSREAPSRGVNLLSQLLDKGPVVLVTESDYRNRSRKSQEETRFQGPANPTNFRSLSRRYSGRLCIVEFAISSPEECLPCWGRSAPIRSTRCTPTATLLKCLSLHPGFLKSLCGISPPLINLRLVYVCPPAIRHSFTLGPMCAVGIDGVGVVLSPSSGSIDYAISMRPDYHQAIIDVIKHYGWRHIAYLYDSHDGQSHMFSLILTRHLFTAPLMSLALCRIHFARIACLRENGGQTRALVDNTS